MIPRVTADALENVARRADDLRHAFEPGFEPRTATGATRAPQAVRNLDPLSVVAPEESYFASSGPNGLRLSRDGSFALHGGELRTREGAAVLGFVRDERAPESLRCDPIDVALGRAANARIDADGTFSYERIGVDPRNGVRRSERVVVGRVALARFPAGTAPLRSDATHVEPPEGIGVSFGSPGRDGLGLLRTFSRDLGRTDPVAAARGLQEAYLSLEALQAAGHARSELAHVALDLVK